MSHPDYSRAARHITPEAVRNTLIEMVDIASPTGREGVMAEYLVHRLRQAGFDAYLQEVSENRPNAVGARPGSGDGVNLLFTGHMDTSYDGDEDYLKGEGFKAKGVYRDGWICTSYEPSSNDGLFGRAFLSMIWDGFMMVNLGRRGVFHARNDLCRLVYWCHR